MGRNPFHVMKFSVPLRLIEIEESGCHIAVSGFVNGNLANILIDTGASQTVFDKNRVNLFSDQQEFEKAETLSKGLGTDSMESYHFTMNQFILGEIELKNFDVVLLDLTHVNSSYTQLGQNPIDMVLGGDFLLKYKAVLSYDTSELVLEL